MSDDSKPSTSKNHNATEASDVESDDDISLSVRQSRETVSEVHPVVSKPKVKRLEKIPKMWRGAQQPPMEDSEDDEEINVIDPYECLNFIDSLRSKEEMDMVTRDREERRKYRNDLSLAESMSRALLLQKELRNRHDNSDEGEIDVVNLPPETTWRHRAHRMRFKKQKFPRNLQNIDNHHQHNSLMSYRTRKATRNLQNEDEEIDVVNVPPNDIPSSSVAIFNFSTEASSPCRRCYALRKRFHTCNYHYTRLVSPPPMVTIDLLDATIDESNHFEQQLSPDDTDMNIDVIDITDTSANSDIVILEDTGDELTPMKQSPMLRRFGLGDCPVCLEDFSNKEIMSTICGHVFCAPCIKGVIRANKKCPNCRKNLTLKSIHPLFI